MRFLADCTVSRLGRWLALAGCDVVCDPRPARALLRDPEVLRSGRTVLGRSPSLGGEALAPGIFLAIRSERLSEQLTEVAHAYPDAFPRAARRGAVVPAEGVAPASFAESVVSSSAGENGGATPRREPMLLSRCSRCNRPLEGPLSLESLGAEAAAVPERVRRWRTEFRRCPRCRRVYWEGTHTERIRAVLARVLASVP